jgi:hypothetical protein
MAIRPPRKTIEFQIVWNELRRSWDVHRENVPTGGFAFERNTAIDLATQAAQFEAIDGIKTVVNSTLNGKRKAEWSS